jgi:hypothetical protein
MKSSDALASFDHGSSCWRTSQACLLQTLDDSSDVFSGPWPRSGTMRNGVCYPQPMSERHTSGNGSGSWPTPTVDDANNVTRTSGSQQSLARDTFQWATPAASWPTPAARDWKGESGAGRQERRDDPTDTLPNAARQWATPTANEDAAGVSTGMQEMLTHQAKWFDGGMPSQSEAQTTLSDLSPVKQRRAGLNPRFGLWLMGYPAGWLDSVESATASSQRARSKSSAP